MKLLTSELTIDILKTLRIAALTGADDALKLEGLRRTDVNTTDSLGRTALMLSAADGNVDACRILIAAGASVCARDSEGRTPAALASLNKHSALALFLGNQRPTNNLAVPATGSQPPIEPATNALDDNDADASGWIPDPASRKTIQDQSISQMATAFHERLSRHSITDNREDWSSVALSLPAGQSVGTARRSASNPVGADGFPVNSARQSQRATGRLGARDPSRRAGEPGSRVSPPRSGTICGRIWEAADKLLRRDAVVPTLGALRCVVADQSFNHNTISVQYYKWRDYRSAHVAVDWEEAQGVRAELEMQEAALPPPSASGDTSGSGLNPVGPIRPTGEAAREAIVRDFLENRYALAGTIPALEDLHQLLGDSGLDIRFVVTQFFEWRRTRGITEPTPLLTSTQLSAALVRTTADSPLIDTGSPAPHGHSSAAGGRKSASWPDATTLQGRVWAAADEFYLAGKRVTLAVLEQHPPLRQINSSLIRVEIAKWNRFLGMDPSLVEAWRAGVLEGVAASGRIPKKGAAPKPQPRTLSNPSLVTRDVSSVDNVAPATGNGTAAGPQAPSLKMLRDPQSTDRPDPVTDAGRTWAAADELLASGSPVPLAVLERHPALRWFDSKLIRQEHLRWRSFNANRTVTVQEQNVDREDNGVAGVSPSHVFPAAVATPGSAAALPQQSEEGGTGLQWVVKASLLARDAGISVKDMRPANGAFWVLLPSTTTGPARALARKLLALGFDHVPGHGFNRT